MRTVPPIEWPIRMAPSSICANSDFVIRSEISGETFHHPVVPLIVHAFAPSLNEQHVTWYSRLH